MTTMKPNRTREQSVNNREVGNKDNGEQHLYPMDEPEKDPHRPHRLNRRDMQKPFAENSTPQQED
jgi:hypothetical protein